MTTADETTRFVWSSGYNDALATVARADGYTAAVGEAKGKGVVTKEKVAAKLAEFTDEELAAMGLTRKPAKKK